MYVYERAGWKDMSEDVIDNPISLSFWTDIELFKELLEPIDEAIKMSESDKSHLGLVLSQWASIRSHLCRMAITFPFLHEFLGPDSPFKTRYKRQVYPIHLASAYLDPRYWQLPIDADSEQKVYEFIDKHTI